MWHDADFYAKCHLSLLFNISVGGACNGYRHRKWTQQSMFKSWTRLIIFHIALIHLEKV